MRQSYFPSTDKGLLGWAQNFLSVASSAADHFGLTEGQLTAFGALVQAYQAALAACDPGVRNKVAVLDKRQTAANLKASARLLVSIVRGQAAVTDAQKIELGLTVRSAPSQVGPPPNPPHVGVVSVVGRRVTVRLRDSASASRRGRPVGAKGASIWLYTGPTAPSDPSLFKFEFSTSKTVVDIVFPESVAPGSTVWVTAQWFNQRQQTGPAARPVSAVIQFGMTTAG